MEPCLDLLVLAVLASHITAFTMDYNGSLAETHQNATTYAAQLSHATGSQSKGPPGSTSVQDEVTTPLDHGDSAEQTKAQDQLDTKEEAQQRIRISNHLKKVTADRETNHKDMDASFEKLNSALKDKHVFTDRSEYPLVDKVRKKGDKSSKRGDGAMYDYVQDQMMNDFAPVSKTSKPSQRSRNKYRDSRRNRNNGQKQEKAFSNEYRIKRDVLTQDYDKTSRPVHNDSSTVTASVGMSLFHILDTNEKMQTLSALIAIRVRWVDEYLTWNASDYGGVDTIWVPAMHIWTPDIFINNFADDSFQDFMNTFAIIESSGTVLWMFPAVIKTYCTLDVRHFPFDKQKCDIVFISWTFNGLKVNMTYNETEHSAVYYKPKNQEWFVDRVEATRHEEVYACCVEPYPDVTFTIHMTRRSLFYIINLIFPCLLIYTVSFLGFFLPAESGEKVNLEITILLALVVFLLMVGETLPPTPDAIPALGLLFGTTMIMVSIALVMAVIVTNLYLRKDSGKRVPFFVRKILLAKAVALPSRMTSLNSSRKFSPAAILRHQSNNHQENHQPHHNHHHHQRESSAKYTLQQQQELEMDNMSQLSDQDTSICSNSKCRRRRKSIRPFPRGSCDPEHTAILTAEWTVLATNVDRIFFWLFLFSSAAALITIFAKIPNFTAIT